MISQQEYQSRRKRLAEKLSKDSIAIIPAAQEVLRNGDAHYRFRQDSNFYYLTGLHEPDALLIITSDKESILFNRPRNPSEELWTGKRLGQEGAMQQLGMDAAYALEQMDTELPKLFSGKSTIYYALGKNSLLENSIRDTLNTMKQQVRRGTKAPEVLHDLEPLLSEMRLFKSEAELQLMRQAAAISVAAHLRAMQQCRHLDYEYQLEAELIHEFCRQGCRSSAYDSIVGGGENACTLHYTANNKALVPGELILIDAGAEYENYAADITRTFPANGVFSEEQKKIYELVLKAQQAGIALVKPGLPYNEIQQTIIRIITTGLCELEILNGDVEELIAKEAYKPFYMHNSGHWLGLDVHDAGLYKINGEWRPLAAGMVLTVEPGIYISADLAHVDKRWHSIGVRIEDDVLVTATGHEVLTKALPVTCADIEALMRD